MKRKRTTIQEARQFLSGVDQSVAFYVSGGAKINSMEELASALVSMDDHTYKFHVDPDKNDFANWIRDVLKDQNLSKEIVRARNRTSAAKKVSSRIDLLKEMIG